MQLRDYQQAGVDRLRAAYAAGKRAPLFVLPTGGGKTVTFSYMTEHAVSRGRRVLILVHRQELLRQASRSLNTLGVTHGLIAPGYQGERANIAVGSIQTVDRRQQRASLPFDFVIVDEAHHVNARTWSRVLAGFPQAQILGVTATPMRLDGRGLGVDHGGLFDELVVGPSISELIQRGYLVPPVVYAYPPQFDLKGIRRTGGDVSGSALASRVDKPTITGDAVEHYTRLSPGEPAIAFCASIQHAEHVAAEFCRAGYVFKTIHGKLGDGVRQEMIADLASGRVHGLASVDLISEGTDIPVVSTAILLRPTESTSLYLQQVGRILRTAPGKTRGLVLDHVGNCLKHGLPDEDRDWTLAGERTRGGSGEAPIMIRQCKKCFAVWEKGIKCQYCGHINPAAIPRQPQQQEGELEQVDKERLDRLRNERKLAYARAGSYQEVLALTRKYGDKPGYAYMYWNAKQNKKRGGR